MSRNFYRLWVVLIVISSVIGLWFSGTAAKELWNFFQLNAKTTVKILNWQVREITSSRFAMEAEYQFEIKGETYSGKTIFKKPQFLNRFAAENYMRLHGSKRWETWYRTGNPSCNSLEKQFPQKQCLQALLTLGVFTYFFFVRGMVLRLVR